MKIGTDAVLLGTWADAPDPSRILDIGTGTGILALMLAQRFPGAVIDAVDVIPDAVEQARENFRSSPWADRINGHRSAIQEFQPRDRYALIVTNPPFFRDGIKPDQSARAIARHDDNLSLADLAAAVNRLLTDNGILCVILPTEQATEFSQVAAEHNLFCSASTSVHPTPEKACKRCLMKFGRHAADSGESDSRLTVEIERHVYSPEFTAMARDFLLRL